MQNHTQTVVDIRWTSYPAVLLSEHEALRQGSEVNYRTSGNFTRNDLLPRLKTLGPVGRANFDRRSREAFKTIKNRGEPLH